MGEDMGMDDLRRWIGREEIVEDQLTATLAERFHATLSLPGAPPREGEVAPGLIHFCLCQPATPAADLGRDGHLTRGVFLPPVPLPRRMWAGGELRFTGDLRVGGTVRRRSRIADISEKNGRSGRLCFVAVDHDFDQDGVAIAHERQTIVYRDAPAPGAPAAAPLPPAPEGATRRTIDATPTLLFRYSALTFNGHRIHYDWPYATGVEGYPGLVVHGPLQATLLLHLAAEVGGAPPAGFSFRSLSPLFADDPMVLHADTRAGGTLALWTARPGGPVAMQAEARW